MKNQNVTLIFKTFLFICLSMIAFSCEDDEKKLSAEDQKLLDQAKEQQAEKEKQTPTKMEILDAMKSLYLWYDKIPAEVDATDEQDPLNFYYNLLYRAFDKWSFILTEKEYNDFESARYYGHGFGASTDLQGDMRVTFVIKNTPAYRAGIKRGWKFVKVNSVAPQSADHLFDLLGSDTVKNTNIIEFEKIDNTHQTITLVKEEITVNPVLDYRVINTGNAKTGFMALQSFMGDSAMVVSELNNVFSYFNNNSIDNLIIDLRYNSGGSIYYAQVISDLIVGRFHNGKLVTLTFNNKIASEANQSSDLELLPNSLNKLPTNVYFITTNESASASELLITCLKPYVNNVKLVGSITAGKPVGMIPLHMDYSDYVLVPIMFQWQNANGETIRYTGIPVDKFEVDDMLHEFGDPTEACLAQVIKHIESGSFGPSKKAAVIMPVKNTTGYRAYLNAY